VKYKATTTVGYSDNRAPGKPGGAPQDASLDQPVENASLYDRMTLARLAFLDAWDEWVGDAGTDVADAVDEFDGTRAVMASALRLKGRANAR
jgi:hypothetical protein